MAGAVVEIDEVAGAVVEIDEVAGAVVEIDEVAGVTVDDYQVVWPLGHRVFGQVQAHDRPTDLAGRTVAYLWDALFRGPEMFDMISELAKERYGDVSFVGWEEFGNFHASASEERRVLDALPERLRAHRVDLVVAAVGA